MRKKLKRGKLYVTGLSYTTYDYNGDSHDF